jgi:hypothetical protein
MDFEVYCDENRPELFTSSKARVVGKYMLLGSVWIEAARREDYKAKIARLREEHNVHGEFKWTRVSPSRSAFYSELVGMFFEESMRFRCIVLPADQMDAVKFHTGDNELMFYKFYYQLLHNWILDFNTYSFFVDLRTNRMRNRLMHLRNVLRNANLFADVQRVQALPSDELDLMQLADVLVGAVGFKFNQDRAESSVAKLGVIRAIESRLPMGAIQPTRKTEEKFNIFRWRTGGGW